MRFSLSILAMVTCLAATSVSAGERGGDSSSGDANSANTVNTRTTTELVRQITRDMQECFQLFEAYRFDCYHRAFKFAAVKVKGSIDYQPAYEALRHAENRINAAVQANLDPGAKKIRKGFQRFSAVKPAAVAAVKQETVRALEEAQTILLRSPAPHQKPHFQKIAAVIDSNKVLIRSALRAPHLLLRRLALGFWADRFG
ncbi:hypothetical protein [Tritonibacter horizontis]|uniref:DUF4142 domain-containing protein n=1 Tax=Tritonibacter horizontis TaxID=1768241 RepID=A0A132BRG8_9RHOB|nr:hypothetical protein [Tritonibacter horizontis]KUP90612.1 hypothetical protein TRIHO_44780 [Tritonibacter horizontis]